jgi:predicted component of type VI protein secretion system
MSDMLDSLSPQTVEETAKAGLLLSKVESNWRNYQRLHAELIKEAHASSDGAANLAFKRGYERHLQELEQIGTLS